MSTISVTLPNDGETIDAADYNVPINTIVSAINGGIDNNNIAASAGIVSSKLNFGGAGAGVWWEEIARTTLTVAGDVLTVSLPTRKYLKALIYATSTGGNISGLITFNSDTSANYARRLGNDGAADTTGTSLNNVSVVNAMTGTLQIELQIVNVATTEKVFYFMVADSLASGAATIPDRLEGSGKWANTTNAISTITVTNGGTGDYAIGSEIVVLGHN